MKMKFKPHAYQLAATQFIMTTPRCACLLDTGLGKTATTLHALAALDCTGTSLPALVVGPLKVVQKTWPDEIKNWDQFNHLTTSLIHGSPAKRAAALAEPADLHLINAEGIKWLSEQKNLPGWMTLVIDESTKFKTWGSARSRALRRLAGRFPRVILLTGTPAPNATKNIEHIFSQYRLLDDRLGKNLTEFRQRFCHQKWYPWATVWEPLPGAIEQLAREVAPVTLHQSKKDHLPNLPELVVEDVEVELPAKALKIYKNFERELFATLPDGQDLLALAGSQKYIKCRQLANGQAYDEDGQTHVLHTAKVDALEILAFNHYLKRQPMLVGYQYKHDLDAIRARLGQVPAINGATDGRDTDHLVDMFNAGEIPILCAHPAAMSWGLNLQKSGASVVWYAQPSDAEHHKQFIDRIHRQGATGASVHVYRLIAKETIDQQVAKALEAKAAVQSDFLHHLKGESDGKKNNS
tara:strand:- start:2559 stop:3956 length:1398 start_codon:yes stop_codon:yes gene_type:complete